jgi:hypothetical protein
MRKKRPREASVAEVRITREGDSGVIAFIDPAVAVTHLSLGPDVHRMDDQEFLDRFNEVVRAQTAMAADYEHVAVEIPPGRPQIDYSQLARQWSPRGDVLRCGISDGGPDNEPIIHIDDRELSWAEFGRLLTTYAGWGMRIVFVPEGDLLEEPRIEMREPGRSKR